MFFNVYLICLRCTRGSTINRTKGARYIRCKGKFLERESIEACFQGERLSQGKNERYDFRVIPFVKGGDIIHMKGERVIKGL
jgi:hypothetical protein